MLLWAWIILDSGGYSVSLLEITDEKFIDECVKEHNWARSSVKPPSSDMLYMVRFMGISISQLFPHHHKAMTSNKTTSPTTQWVSKII